MDTSESRLEMPGKFRNVLLEKDGEGHWDRSCEKDEVLHRVREEINILHKIKRRNANWIGHM